MMCKQGRKWMLTPSKEYVTSCCVQHLDWRMPSRSWVTTAFTSEDNLSIWMGLRGLCCCYNACHAFFSSFISCSMPMQIFFPTAILDPDIHSWMLYKAMPKCKCSLHWASQDKSSTWGKWDKSIQLSHSIWEAASHAAVWVGIVCQTWSQLNQKIKI